MVTDRKRRETVAALNHLIQTCLDAHDGYQTVAGQIEDMHRKKLFGRFAMERKVFADELSGLVERLGGTPAERGSVTGALHRGWIQLTGGMAEPLHGNVLKECLRGEDLALRTYEEALAKGLPADAKAVVERQLRGIADARDRVAATGR